MLNSERAAEAFAKGAQCVHKPAATVLRPKQDLFFRDEAVQPPREYGMQSSVKRCDFIYGSHAGHLQVRAEPLEDNARRVPVWCL